MANFGDPILRTIIQQISGSGGGADEKAKVSAADTTADYLTNKLVAGTNITLTTLNPGANEQIRINSAGGGGGAMYPSGMAQAEADGLVAYWKMDDNTGNVITDSTTTFQHNMVSNGNTWLPGLSGSAINLNGFNQRFTNILPALIFDNSFTSLSISHWIFPTSKQISTILAQMSLTSNQVFTELWYDGVSNIYAALWVKTANGSVKRMRGNTPISLNTWSNIVCTWSGGETIKIYVNGVLESTLTIIQQVGGSLGTQLETVSAANLYIGAYYGIVNYFPGSIDEMAVWKNKTLTQVEINNLYNGGAPIPLF